MGTLNLISYDERKQKMIASMQGSVQDTYEALDITTRELEQGGVFWVEDQQLDKHTLIRKFATPVDGHVASLIVVGSVASH